MREGSRTPSSCEEYRAPREYRARRSRSQGLAPGHHYRHRKPRQVGGACSSRLARRATGARMTRDSRHPSGRLDIAGRSRRRSSLRYTSPRRARPQSRARSACRRGPGRDSRRPVATRKQQATDLRPRDIGSMDPPAAAIQRTGPLDRALPTTPSGARARRSSPTEATERPQPQRAVDGRLTAKSTAARASRVECASPARTRRNVAAEPHAHLATARSRRPLRRVRYGRVKWLRRASGCAARMTSSADSTEGRRSPRRTRRRRGRGHARGAQSPNPWAFSLRITAGRPQLPPRLHGAGARSPSPGACPPRAGRASPRLAPPSPETGASASAASPDPGSGFPAAASDRLQGREGGGTRRGHRRPERQVARQYSSAAGRALPGTRRIAPVELPVRAGTPSAVVDASAERARGRECPRRN